MKVNERYFPVVMFIMLYKGGAKFLTISLKELSVVERAITLALAKISPCSRHVHSREANFALACVIYSPRREGQLGISFERAKATS